MTNGSHRGVGGIVLAGGRNSRMRGADKAFLTVNGEAVISRSLRVLQQCCSQLVVVSNRPEKYAGFDVEVTADEYPGMGPLAGIHAGLGRMRCDHAFVVACDMPFLRIEPIRFLIDHADAREAVIPWWDGDIEPLHALYATSLRQRMRGALESGMRAIRDFLPLIDVKYIAEIAMREVSGAEESFRNVNTPEDAVRFAVDALTSE